MHYIKKNSVKKRARELGFRTNKGFLHELDIMVDGLIHNLAHWTRPRKTMTAETLAGYLQHHKMKR